MASSHSWSVADGTCGYRHSGARDLDDLTVGMVRRFVGGIGGSPSAQWAGSSGKREVAGTGDNGLVIPTAWLSLQEAGVTAACKCSLLFISINMLSQ